MEGGVLAETHRDRNHNRNKVMALDGEELIRRFLLHILPKGIMRIRQYGFLVNHCRRQKLALPADQRHAERLGL